MMEEESKTAQTKNKTVQPNCTNSKKNQRKKKKSKKAKSDSKDSSVASNESLNALDNVQSYSTKDEAISPVEEYPPNAIMKPPQDAYEDSPKTSHCKTTDTRSSETLQKELQAMKEKEWKLQKRLEELQIKLERLMLL